MSERPQIFENLYQKEYELRRKLITCGRVTNPENGYLRLPWVNEVIDVRLQDYAAELLAFQLQDLQMKNGHVISVVAGVPSLGGYLSVSLARAMSIPLATSRKGKIIPAVWDEAVFMDHGMKQYHTGVIASHIYNGISPGSTAVLTDDILGEGDTTVPIIENLRALGITPYLAVYAAKLYRPGYERLLQLGVQPVFVYGISRVSGNNEFELTQPVIK